MKGAMIFLVTVGFFISCVSREKHSKSETEIVGTYVREYSFKAIDPETGHELGVSTVRDTIFIRSKLNGIEVANNKWMLNDHGRQGWRNMEHSENRPMETYHVKFDPADNSLNAESHPTLHFDFEKGLLYVGKKLDFPYHKV
jgi:hypothetical protein